ncbi:hypothetical protein B7463_g12366, partial [Scytalidium lignicola]
MASFRKSLYVVGVISTLLSRTTHVIASPISGRGLEQKDIDLGLGLGINLGLDSGLGGILDFCKPPLVIIVIPYITVSLAVIESAGIHTIGAGEAAEVVTVDKPTTLRITKTGTNTASSLCSTETTFISTWSDSKGKPTTTTCRWSPNPPQTCIGSGTPTVTTTVPCTTSTTTTTISLPTTTSTTTLYSTLTTATTAPYTTTTATVTSPSCPAPSTPPLSCDQYGYLIQEATLYRVDLSTGINTVVRQSVGDGSSSNAIAYNVLDNYIYGYQSANATLVRIFSDGSSEVVTEAGAIPSVNVGDIDLNGRYWISSGGRGWWVLDLYPGSATYGQVLNSGTANTLGITVDDWVYLPNEGQYLWSVGRNSSSTGTSLIRFSMTTFE